MSNVVVKSFKTYNRKFAPAAPGEKPVTVTAADIDPRGAFTLEDWIKRGFVKVESDEPETAKPSPSKSFKSPPSE